MTFYWLIIVGILLHFKIFNETNKVSHHIPFEILHEDQIGMTDLKPCDILVKPNHNWLPGSSLVKGGKGFGHAVIVIRGAKDTCLENLLAKTVIFESHSRDVPFEYQLRKSAGLITGTDLRIVNESFGKQNKDYRYRLRPNISEEQKKEILELILKQDPDTSCWRSLKAYKQPFINSDNEDKGREKDQWYCSLLIWQAFYSVAGIDLDANQGTIVYPNDLIVNHFFDNTPDNKENRVRF